MVRDARAQADKVRPELAAVLVPPDDDDVIGGRGVTEILGDGIDDGVGRDRAGQPTQDAGEGFGLAASAGVEVGHRRPMHEGGEASDHHDAQQDAIREGRLGCDRAQ
jgi:hypothetical protein